MTKSKKREERRKRRGRWGWGVWEEEINRIKGGRGKKRKGGKSREEKRKGGENEIPQRLKQCCLLSYYIIEYLLIFLYSHCFMAGWVSSFSPLSASSTDLSISVQIKIFLTRLIVLPYCACAPCIRTDK